MQEIEGHQPRTWDWHQCQYVWRPRGHGHQDVPNRVPEGLGPVGDFCLLLPLPRAFTRWIAAPNLLGPS